MEIEALGWFELDEFLKPLESSLVLVQRRAHAILSREGWAGDQARAHPLF